MRFAILICAAALSACSAQSDASKEAIDYEAINEAAMGPATAITPDPISFADIEASDLFGAGCNVEHPDGDNLLLIAQGEAAYFLLDGELVRLAPHPGSGDLPYGATAHYDGRTYSAEIELEQGSDAMEGPELTSFSGTLTISDAKERVVFEHSGRITCGA